MRLGGEGCDGGPSWPNLHKVKSSEPATGRVFTDLIVRDRVASVPVFVLGEFGFVTVRCDGGQATQTEGVVGTIPVGSAGKEYSISHVPSFRCKGGNRDRVIIAPPDVWSILFAHAVLFSLGETM